MIRLRNAFSLIELLVVIAIIALLVSICLPSLNAAKQLAQGVVCSANMRNMSLAVNFYSDENDQWLPSAGPADPLPGSERYWFMNESLVRHAGVSMQRDSDGFPTGPPIGTSSLTCPSHCQAAQFSGGDSREYGLSYVMNGTWGLGDWCSITRDYRRVCDFDKPDETLGMTDGNSNKYETSGVVLYHGCPKGNFEFRHRESLNAFFLDSHVTSMKANNIPMGRNNRFESFWSETQ